MRILISKVDVIIVIGGSFSVEDGWIEGCSKGEDVEVWGYGFGVNILGLKCLENWIILLGN